DPAFRRRERRPRHPARRGQQVGLPDREAGRQLRRELRREPQAARLRARLEPPVEPGRTDVRSAAALDRFLLARCRGRIGRRIKKLTKRVLNNMATEYVSSDTTSLVNASC